MPSIRPAHLDDATAVVGLRALVYPYLVQGVEGTRQAIAATPRNRRILVAEVDGAVVGWVSAYATGTAGEVSLLHVHPEQRGRGLGTALLTAALDHLGTLGVDRIRAWALEGSLDFARAHGFTPSRAVRYAALDLRELPPMPPVPPGVELLPMDTLELSALHAAHVAASADEPGDVPVSPLSYDDWRASIWDNPDAARSASTAAVVDGAPVALAELLRDGHRVWSDMTATLPTHRGRGLARLAKLAALHRARAAGATAAYTSNDEANAPMLAVNTRLCYRPVATQWSCLRAGGDR
ncbi:N-acetyltransferase family protein [Micromonospora sp. MS34]|uniref:GNAT family N-acetyltransferase n=1 Tax=Micromonospora sp. MS34 TaxID=3385971 RepID=UPI0039A2E540